MNTYAQSLVMETGLVIGDRKWHDSNEFGIEGGDFCHLSNDRVLIVHRVDDMEWPETIVHSGAKRDGKLVCHSVVYFAEENCFPDCGEDCSLCAGTRKRAAETFTFATYRWHK